MKKLAAAAMFIILCAFGAIGSASAASWYTATITSIGPVAGNYYVYATSPSWSNTTKFFSIYPTMNNSITAIGLTAMSTTRNVSMLLNSTTDGDYCMGMMLQ